MAPHKETIMVLKVDLDCPRCYRKVKKLLCQFPQIHDQVYNEKQNTVMIKVVCCSPEKIRDKLCCKGGKSIKSIEILEPKKPPPPPAEKPAPPPPEEPADPAPAPPPAPVEKPKEEAPPPPPETAPEPAPAPPPEKMKKNGSKNGSRKIGSPKPEKPPEEAPPPKDPEPAPEPEPKPEPPPPKPSEPAPVLVPQADPVQYYPVYQVNPVNMCCSECYEGHTAGPCNHGYGYGYGYGVPAAPPPAGGWGYYGGGCPPPPPPGGYGGYNNYKPGYCVSRCGDYISDENPTACVIM